MPHPTMNRLAILTVLAAALACSGGATYPPDASTSACPTCPSNEKCNETTGQCEPMSADAGHDGGSSSGGCSGDAACAPGTICDLGAHACVPGCSDQHACAGALECCDGQCVDTASDPAHCGGCSVAACTADQQCTNSMCVTPKHVGGLVSLYEASGSVSSPLGSTSVKLLIPFVAFVNGAVQHAYSDQQPSTGFGCTGDHYDAAHPQPPDADAGTIRITGYSGGKLLLTQQSAASTITCTRPGANYLCSYGDGKAAATEPYSGSASPLGGGPITFTGEGGADFGTFTLNGSPNDTLWVHEDLSKIQYSATSDTTLDYTCSGSCASSLVLVSLLATQNTPSNPGGSSSSTGAVSCVADATGSITLPKGAIAAMFGSDTSLKSVMTTVILLSSNIPSAMDANHQTVISNVGKGVFGIAPK